MKAHGQDSMAKRVPPLWRAVGNAEIRRVESRSEEEAEIELLTRALQVLISREYFYKRHSPEDVFEQAKEDGAEYPADAEER